MKLNYKPHKEKKKSKPYRKFVSIECRNKDKLDSFLNVMSSVAEDMNIVVSDGETSYYFGADY